MAARRKAPPVEAAKLDLHALGARVVSVYGPFESRVLIEMPAGAAAEMFPEPLIVSGHRLVVESIVRDLAELAERAPEIAVSTVAASAIALAREIDNPYNSATSKSMCAKALMDAMEMLRELAPPVKEKDHLDDLTARRAARRSAGVATAKDSVRP